MRKISFLILVCAGIFFSAHAQNNAGKVLWAFPITDYMVPLNDSVKVVQIVLPPQIHFTQDKQLGMLRGISHGADVDTGSKGWAKCHLIKNQFNYFAVHLDTGKTPRAGDLIYTFIPAIAGNNEVPIFHCASHNIIFVSVQDSAFYKPSIFFEKRMKVENLLLAGKMVDDIRFTGNYFLEHDSSMNKLIEDGPYKGDRILQVMIKASVADLNKFLGYVAARPRRYAGNRWKISETFATWLLNGSPMVVED